MNTNQKTPGIPEGYTLEQEIWSDGSYAVRAFPVQHDTHATPITSAEIVAESYGAPAGTDAALAALFSAAPTLYSALFNLLNAQTAADTTPEDTPEYDACIEALKAAREAGIKALWLARVD